DTLAYKLDLFRSSGRYPEVGYDLFKVPSWVAVMIGQGIDPQGFDPMVESIAPRDADRVLSGMRAVIAQAAQQMPSHQQFIDRHCRASGTTAEDGIIRMHA
ncbi:MAG TPA: tryptophan 7-halogenase, partial [Sphingomicrobium sp.]|nr:tryptophan 7-halogenase [Sphingomicrobium sp.]